MRSICLAVAIALLAGCTATTNLVRSGGERSRKLTASDSIYVAVPKDGSYGKDTYTGSGLNTTQVLYAALAKHVHGVEAGHEFQSFDEAMTYTKEHRYSILVYPTILHWEDRATEWSGIPDKIEVKIEVLDVNSDIPLDSVVVTGKSKWATFGGDHPQDLLPQPVEEYINGLF